MSKLTDPEILDHYFTALNNYKYEGYVVLSWHYQTGLQVSPSRVEIEKEPDLYDPIPFIRLSMPGPVSRVTLTWKNR